MPTLILKNGNGHVAVPLLSTMNLYEHELLIISPSGLFTEMQAGSAVRPEKQQAVATRMKELVSWVARGHTLIVVGLKPQPYHWVQAGKNAVRTGIEHFPPFNSVSLTAKSGTNIRSAPALASVLDRFVGSLSYSFILQGSNLIPLLFTRTTQKTVGPAEIVAGAIQCGNGFVLFTPEGGTAEYWEALAELPPMLRAPKPEYPPWINQFLTKPEAEAFAQAQARKAEMDKLQAEISALDGRLEQARQLKQLFVGTGPMFENAVSAALVELGLQVVKGPHPRADLLATNGSRVAAIEAKGVEATAKEEYVRQVMMWMPEVDAALALEADAARDDPLLEDYRKQLTRLDLSDRDARFDCKGILILGTFRLAPLDQRTQPDFPENVKTVLVRQDICALTGLQLFVLVQLARVDETLKEKFRQALFDTRGVLEMGLNWTEALEDHAKKELFSETTRSNGTASITVQHVDEALVGEK